jgi:hypothetical protein
LAAYSVRRSRGVWRPITDWWRGAPPAPVGVDEGFVSVGEQQPDWGDQVARITMAAKRVLVRRGLLDITHGLRRPSLPGAFPVDHNGSPVTGDPDPMGGDRRDRPGELSGVDQGRPGSHS